MTAGLTTIWLGLLLAWILWGLAGLILPGPAAIAAGALSSAVAVWAFRDTLVLRGVVAVLGSFRVVLAFLVLRHMATGLGIEVMPFGTVELVVFVLAYGAFLATATGTLPADIYRLGYAPLPVGSWFWRCVVTEWCRAVLSCRWWRWRGRRSGHFGWAAATGSIMCCMPA